MRRLLSVAPVLLWLVTPLAFAQLPGITSQPLPGRWAKRCALTGGNGLRGDCERVKP